MKSLADKGKIMLKTMQEVLTLESGALALAAKRLQAQKVEALSQILEKLINMGGALIFCGVGKSGHIARKLSSTFVSLGLPSFFLHPTEALHGDLGNMREGDAIVFLSKSGTTEEIIKLIPYITIAKDMRIGLLGNTDSPLAKEMGVVLDCGVEKEACLNNQAPTTSSTVALGMGDAISVLYEKMVGLSKEGFASNHPGGLLGKTLRMKVSHLMLGIDKVPTISSDAKMKDVIIAMTKYPVGACAVLDGQILVGIVVEGDIRRSLNADENALATEVAKVMNTSPITIGPDNPAYEGLKLMEGGERQISILPVLENKKFLGFLRLHDLLKEGFVVS